MTAAEDPLGAFVAEVPRFTAAILGAIGEDGVDHDAYDAAVTEMGATGHTDAVLIVWAQVLACTHRTGDQAIGGWIPTIPIHHEQWRHPVRRHGGDLIDTASAAVGTGDGLPQLLDAMERISGELGNDIWWLIGVMAAATRPVLHTLGGLERFWEVSELVQACAHELTPVAAIPSTAAGLSAITAGHLDPARTYLSLRTPRQLLGVLLPVSAQVLRRGTVVEVSLDSDGIPEGIGDSTAPEIVLLRPLVESLLAGDRQRFLATTDALNAADDETLIEVTWALAMTIGVRLGQHMASR